MKAALYIVSQSCRVELRTSGLVIERNFPKGLAAPAEEGDEIALEHLVRIGLATRKSVK